MQYRTQKTPNSDTMKRAIFKLLAICLSAAIYCIFGIMCAAAWLAFSFEPRQCGHESSPELCDFLEDTSAKSREFTAKQLGDGITGIILKRAQAAAKTSGAVVMPAIPIISETADGLRAEIPVEFSTIAGAVRTAVVCGFSTNGRIELKSASLGNAKIPRCLRRFAEESLEAHYADFCKTDIERIARLGVSKNGSKFILKK